MAWYNVVCPRCQEEYRVNLVGPHKTREWKLENFDWTCDECKAALRAEASKEAAERNQTEGLPALTGSEKQVAWAESIRAEVWETLTQLIQEVEMTIKVRPEFEKAGQLAILAIEEIASETSAKWWIENGRGRGLESWRQEVNLRAKRLRTEPEKHDTVASKAATEAMKEATIRPEKPATEVVAEIQADDKKLTVKFPEKRDDFRGIMKSLGFRWSDGWKKSLSFRTENKEDRVVEVACRLLAAGFIVRVFDNSLRERIARGEYDPECRYWVFQNGGHFAIEWPYGDNFYSEAIKISGARWDREAKVMTIPKEAYEEVLGFAEARGFKISQGAQNLINEAEEAKRKSLIVEAPEVKEAATPRHLKGKPKKVATPDKVEIDESLRDED